MTAAAGRTPVRVALIGFGIRGVQIAKALDGRSDGQIVAVVDVYAGRRARATELVGADVLTTAHYGEVLSRRDVEAVVIATPDHLHFPIALDALQAGKDVYCEAPVVHLGQDASRLQQAAKGRIFQVGGALESAPACQKAKELIAAGTLGRVTFVRATWDTVSALDAWQRPFPPDASPETIDFAAFLGAGPARQFDLHRFFRWPCYRDYGSGLAGARIVPLLTSVHSLLGLTAPVRASLSGGTWRWKDGREVADTLAGMFDYHQGITVAISATQNGGHSRELQLVGTEATLVLTDARATVVPASEAEPYTDVGETWAKTYRDWFYMMHGLSPQGAPRREFPAREGQMHEVAISEAALPAHLANFVACVRTRQEPVEPLRLGVQVAEAVAAASGAPGQRARLAPR